MNVDLPRGGGGGGRTGRGGGMGRLGLGGGGGGGGPKGGKGVNQKMGKEADVNSAKFFFHSGIPSKPLSILGIKKKEKEFRWEESDDQATIAINYVQILSPHPNS